MDNQAQFHELSRTLQDTIQPRDYPRLGIIITASSNDTRSLIQLGVSDSDNGRELKQELLRILGFDIAGYSPEELDHLIVQLEEGPFAAHRSVSRRVNMFLHTPDSPDTANGERENTERFIAQRSTEPSPWNPSGLINLDPNRLQVRRDVENVPMPLTNGQFDTSLRTIQAFISGIPSLTVPSLIPGPANGKIVVAGSIPAPSLK